MLTTRIIPCLDCLDGRVVKGVRFRDLVDCGDPAALAARYEADGADEIVLLDLQAGAERQATRLETVRRVRAEISIPLTVGGGIRSLADASAVLDAGADRVSMNAAAIARPKLIEAIAERYGQQATIVAIDAKRIPDGYEAYVRGGREGSGLDALSWAQEAVRRGAGEILLTSIDRDGTGLGYDVDLLRATRARIDAPIIASGGGAAGPRMLGDLLAALDAGADALLLAGALHRGETTLAIVKEALRDAGVAIRSC